MILIHAYRPRYVEKSGGIAEVTDLCGIPYTVEGQSLRATLTGGTYLLFRYE